jgi:hypothetical protein
MGKAKMTALRMTHAPPMMYPFFLFLTTGPTNLTEGANAMNSLQREHLPGVKEEQISRVWLASASAFLLLTLFPCLSVASSRTKTDIVYMNNGDKITGEIQSLQQGQLNVKPDYTNASFAIDWAKVDHLESTQEFIVTDPHGVTHAGSITAGVTSKSVAIVNTKTTTLPHNSVIQIQELGTTFLKRFSGNIDVGTSFAKSNSQTNLTVQAGLAYQSTKHILTFNSNSQFTSQQKTNNTSETTVKFGAYQQLRESSWYFGGLANFLSSSEQKIDLRSTYGLGLAKRIIFTNRTNLNAIGGLGYTVERDDTGTNGKTHSQSLDAPFAVNYSTFRFNSTTFSTSVWVYPDLTSPGHVLMTLNQDIYYKFFSDFYVSISFYDNYDNRPVAGAPDNNLGASTTVGWSFH